jgi:hypothetical protein
LTGNNVFNNCGFNFQGPAANVRDLVTKLLNQGGTPPPRS